ncbi:MAG: hypothetical protein E6660_21805, partial [Bradyrhizobium sp.]|nr:hypothetical protein [Bradyrhizobium sp.]
MTVDCGKRQKIAIFGLLVALVMSLLATVGHAAENLRFACVQTLLDERFDLRHFRVVNLRAALQERLR